MEVGIFGDYNSFMTGMGAIKAVWDKTDMKGAGTETSKDSDPIGWERFLAEKIEYVNFEVTPCCSNQEIINQLVTSIQQKPKDLYIVQTTSWYMSSFGIMDYDYFQHRTKHNLTYNLIDPRSHVGKRYPTAVFPYHPNYTFNKTPFTVGGLEGDPSTPRWISQTDADFSIDTAGLFKSVFTSCIDNIEDPNLIEGQEDARRMRAVYGELGKVLMHDHLGSQLKQEEIFATINLLNLLSQTHNIWYFHWFPPLGRVEDFNYMEDPHSSGHRISDFRRQNRKDTIGLNYAKLERLNTDKRIHPFSVMDWMIMTHRDKLNNETDWLNEAGHKIVFDEYICSNDTLMNILKNG